MPDPEPQTIRLRHYTRVSSMKRILEEGVIVARDQNKVFVERADRKPMGAVEAKEYYLLGRGKGNAYVEFDASIDELHEQSNPVMGFTERYLIGDVDLTDRNPEGFRNR